MLEDFYYFITFDSSCKCKIKSCEEFSCHDKQCSTKAHILCTCPREKKIPIIELEFILKERQKRGEKGGMQIALADLPEDARQRSRLMRKEDQQRREQEKASKAAQIEAELEERINAEDETTNETVAIEDDASLEEATENETTKAKTGISKRNTVTLTLTAQTSMRYDTVSANVMI